MSETTASSSPPGSPLVSDRFTYPTAKATFILHDHKAKKILVESDFGNTVFLSKDDLKSHSTNPQQYHWHCIHMDGCFRFRNAFSKKMLCVGEFYRGRYGYLVNTDFCDQEDSEFYLAVNDGAFTLLYEVEGLLHPVSVAYDDYFNIFYPIVHAVPKKQHRVDWKFEQVTNGNINGIEVDYDSDDYKL